MWKARGIPLLFFPAMQTHELAVHFIAFLHILLLDEGPGPVHVLEIRFIVIRPEILITLCFTAVSHTVFACQ